MQRWAIALVAAMCTLVVAGGSTALADATGGHNAVPLTLSCAGVELTLVSPSEQSAVAQVTGGTSVLVAADITLTTTYLDTQTGEPVSQVQSYVYGPGHGTAGGVRARLVSCEETVVVDDPDLGPVTITFMGRLLLVGSAGMGTA